LISTSDFRKGLRIKLEGEAYVIVDFQHARTAQRRAFVRTRLKNIKTGSVQEKTFSAGETFEEPDFEEKTMQYLYKEGNLYNFMDAKTFEEISVAEDALAESRFFLREGSEYKILFFENSPIGADLPASVVLKVISVGPGQKTDAVTNVMKEAVLETGIKLKVPLFIKEGDLIKVDTRTSEYLERL
jgi:elongation factor P